MLTHKDLYKICKIFLVYSAIQSWEPCMNVLCSNFYVFLLLIKDTKEIWKKDWINFALE